jgi:hypothetical protein
MLTHLQVPESDDDALESQTEFEVVPQEPDDAEMWDVSNLNEDELKSSQIKRIYLRMPETLRSTDHDTS